MTLLTSLGLVISNTYKEDEIEIVELYYMQGANVQQICDYLKVEKKKVIDILSDPYYRVLRKPYENYVKEKRKKNA